LLGLCQIYFAWGCFWKNRIPPPPRAPDGNEPPGLPAKGTIPQACLQPHKAHNSSVAVTGTWSDGWLQPRACLAMAMLDTLAAMAGLTQM
jgi:hypothetical protein